MVAITRIGQSPFLNDVSNPVASEVYDLERQKRIADLLTQKGMQSPQGQIVGGRFVKPSWSQYANQMLSSYLGGAESRDVAKQQQELAQKLRQQGVQEAQGVLQALTGRPAQEQVLGTQIPESMLPQGQTAVTDEGDATLVRPAMAAQAPNTQLALARALSAQTPTGRALLPSVMERAMPKDFDLTEGQIRYRINPETGKPEQIAAGGEKLPTEYKEYIKAQEGGFQGTFFDYQNALKRAGAPNVSVNTAKDISSQVGDIAKESRVQATGAVQTADAANRIIQAVDSKNLITGPGANIRLQGAQIADAIGAGGNTTADKIANSRQAVQGLAQLTLQGRKQMRGEGAITESESKLAERAMSGDLSFTAAEIRQLAEAAKRSAKFTYNQHQNIINTMQNNPDAKGLVPYFQVPADADIFNAKPVGGQSSNRTKADQIIQGK